MPRASAWGGGGGGGLTFVSVTPPMTGDGTPGSPLDVPDATISDPGLMSAANVTKLAGIATDATNTPLSSTLPAAVGTAAIGVGTTAARGDHVHALPSVGPGAGAIAHPASITLDAQGRVTAASAGSAPPSYPLSVANGGTGASTLTAHAVLVGNGSSAPAVVGPSASTGKLLTSHGLASDPSFDDPITATGGTVDLPSPPFTFTDATGFVDTGLEFAAPSAGTFWLVFDLLLSATSAPSVAGDEVANLRLYDITAAAVVTGSDRAVGVLAQGTTERTTAASVAYRVTVASTRTLKLQSKADAGSSSGLTINLDSVATYGLTQLNWMKVGN